MDKKRRKFLMIQVSEEFSKKVKNYAKKREISISSLVRLALIKEMEGK